VGESRCVARRRHDHAYRIRTKELTTVTTALEMDHRLCELGGGSISDCPSIQSQLSDGQTIQVWYRGSPKHKGCGPFGQNQ
jgi:hypothetical protein